ncbi:MAG: hypothetical protein WB919_19450 [Candidatus Sulfotelmatobacter sp.]
MFEVYGGFLIGFLGVFGFDEGLQAIEIQFPEVAVLIEPGVDGAERLGIELVDAVASLAMLTNEMGAAKQAQMLGDGGAGDGKGSGNFSGGLAAPPQEIKDRATSGIGKGLESGFG